MANSGRTGHDRRPIRLVLGHDDLVVAEPDVAQVASLIGDPARGTMLLGLLDGRALTATELAWRAGVTPQTASAHLFKLVDGGLLVVERSGRHRYFRLASVEVAECIEAIAVLAPLPRRPRDRDSEAATSLRFARTCYDHLAGRIAVRVADALMTAGILVPSGGEYDVSRDGERWFEEIGLDLEAARKRKRVFARSCLDWSERRPHVAGALGAALLDRFLGLGWLVRRESGRALRLTHSGHAELTKRLGIEL